MIDVYEQKHGPVEDRSEFDGEITVPPHLRNLSLTSLRANRLHGSLFGSLSRSRTFLNISQNARNTFHGSVPDLSRNRFTFSAINSNNNVDDDVDGDESRRMSSMSAVTKITLNASTTLALTEDSSGVVSNGDSSQFSNDQTMFDSSIKSDDGYKSNSIRSLNDVQLRESVPDRSMYCQSLGRPVRVLKPNIYTTKPANFKDARSQSTETYNTEGYMTLIKTNPQRGVSPQNVYRASPNRSVSPLCNVTTVCDNGASQMATSTSTFQRKQASQPSNYFNQNAGFTGELSLNDFTKFKLPRVTLNHSPANQQQ